MIKLILGQVLYLTVPGLSLIGPPPVPADRRQCFMHKNTIALDLKFLDDIIVF